ncbi:MAG: hypothetical protein V4722_05240 [Bacteroidota bacterium]
MKKLLFAVFLFAALQITAQTTRQGTVEYNSQLVPCYIIDLPYSTSVTEDAIAERFKKMGVKGKAKKGFTEYRNVVIPEISSSPIDAMMKVDRTSRKDKDASTVYLVVNPVGLTATTAGSTSVADFATGSTTFLNSLATTSLDYSLELDITNQDNEVKKAEKKFKNLVDDGEDMQKKLKKLQEDIVENTKKQQEQTAEVQKQKEALIQMMSRRRKI